MKRILWISPYAPYDKVAHAGGKCHNYYIKYFQKSGKFDITLLSLCLRDEEKKLDLESYGIKSHIFVRDRTRLIQFRRKLMNAGSFLNPFDKYAGVCPQYERGQILKMLNRYRAEGHVPDIVMLQWTLCVILTPEIRECFPDCKIIAIEEDVTFLGYRRKWENSSGLYGKWAWKHRYFKLHQLELEMLKQDDLIVTNNLKDTCLLLENGIENGKIFTSAPYLNDYSDVKRNIEGKDILFYGAMSREENSLSAIWFIDHVMPLLKDKEIRFVIVGSQPTEMLRRRANDRIIVTGYVENISSYLEKCSCLVAPLLNGAGIKVKVLEAMSAGLPVLTNDIGIEGIPAENGREYFHCTFPEDYAACISNIMNGKYDIALISKNARQLIKKNYNLSEKLNRLIQRIEIL